MKRNNFLVSNPGAEISLNLDLPRLTFPPWEKHSSLRESLKTFVIARWPKEDAVGVGKESEVIETKTLHLEELGNTNQKINNIPVRTGDSLIQNFSKANAKSDSPWYEPPFHRKRRGSKPIEESPPSTDTESTDQDFLNNLMGMETSGPTTDDTEDNMFFAEKYLPDPPASDGELNMKELLRDEEDETDDVDQTGDKPKSEISTVSSEEGWDNIIKHDNLSDSAEEIDFWDEDIND